MRRFGSLINIITSLLLGIVAAEYRRKKLDEVCGCFTMDDRTMSCQ